METMQTIIKKVKDELKKLDILLDENVSDKEALEKIIEKEYYNGFNAEKPTLKIDLNDYDRIEISWGYREGIDIMREGDKIHIDRERCVPNGPDDIDSDYEELLTINI